MMKKLTLFISIILILGLSACSNKPFESDDDDFTLEESSVISFTYDNGLTTETIFEYTFSQSYKYFINSEGTILNFSNINNYKDLTNDIKTLLEAYEGRVSFDTVTSYDYKNKQKLSLGASENDYNYEKITVNEVAYNVNAYISVENGVNLLISYTVFIVGEEQYYIPSFIQMFVAEIHEGISYETLVENNEYNEYAGELIHYKKLIIPTPMKTGFDIPFETMQENDAVIIDSFTRFESIIQEDASEWPTCEILDSSMTSCTEGKYTEVDIQVYDMTANEVYDFYVNNYSGGNDGRDFVFVNMGYTFVLENIDEVEVELQNGSISTVTNATIKVFILGDE